MPDHSKLPFKYRDDGVILHVSDSEGIEIAAFVGPRRRANAALFCAGPHLLEASLACATLIEGLIPMFSIMKKEHADGMGYCLGVLRQVIDKANRLDVAPQYKD